ncbi:coiled-coil domain-containing protein [Methylobacterium pseudosasicola]|uniref:DUF1640 domain-containing protein n=1 Tax=Methylobacterium pseudosasicola TaxID=582667 RepID=A0A1I4PM65_9HYPH|nr:coiled-coil domain-containing protein [Methylobacterium pseudosasicola]SFM28929.1 Protein of unknown function [Methylobacterium pseudosasicola]
MTAVAFDTLRFVRTLRDKAKMSSEQAEGLADAIAEAIQNDLATKTDIAAVRTDIEALRLTTKSDIETLRLATKTDIAAVRTDIEALRLSTKSDIETLRLATKADLAETKAEIIKWMISSIGFQALVIVGGVVALARGFH